MCIYVLYHSNLINASPNVICLQFYFVFKYTYKIEKVNAIEI